MTNEKDETKKDEYRVRDIILRLYQNNDPKYEILEKKKNDDGIEEYITRKIDWKDIMIITPSKGSLSKYTKALREVGIPCHVE